MVLKVSPPTGIPYHDFQKNARGNRKQLSFPLLTPKATRVIMSSERKRFSRNRNRKEVRG
nr:MAG TPA: hypothetical protein [Caudoviricetes sp.]